MLNMVVTCGKDFNWAYILYFQLHHHVGQAKAPLRSNQASQFYMTAFLLHGICQQYAFPGMYLNWTLHDKFPVSFHYRVFSHLRFRGEYDRLAEHFFAVILHMIYEIDPPYRNDLVKESLHSITDWFSLPKDTHICFFRYHISYHDMSPTRWSCKK